MTSHHNILLSLDCLWFFFEYLIYKTLWLIYIFAIDIFNISVKGNVSSHMESWLDMVKIEFVGLCLKLKYQQLPNIFSFSSDYNFTFLCLTVGGLNKMHQGGNYQISYNEGCF